MKKILSTMLLLVVTTAMLSAQEVQSSNAVLIQRCGNTYIYAGEKMNMKEYSAFLSTHNQSAYQQFMNGHKLQKAGWSLFGVGTGMAVLGVALTAIAPTMQDPERPHMGGALTLMAGYTFLGFGACLDLVGIPILGVGYARMHRSVDAYNIAQPTASKPYLSLQTSQNGVGLALKF